MDVESLMRRIESLGVQVRTRALQGKDGAYDAVTKTIWINRSISEGSPRFLSTLAHEYIHALRGDMGPQPVEVEAVCDEAAADFLVSPVEYAFAERLHDGSVVGIARELGVTQRIVRAYQRLLARRMIR